MNSGHTFTVKSCGISPWHSDIQEKHWIGCLNCCLHRTQSRYSEVELPQPVSVVHCSCIASAMLYAMFLQCKHSDMASPATDDDSLWYVPQQETWTATWIDYAFMDYTLVLSVLEDIYNYFFQKWSYMGQVTKVRLSCCLVLLSFDSKNR